MVLNLVFESRDLTIDFAIIETLLVKASQNQSRLTIRRDILVVNNIIVEHLQSQRSQRLRIRRNLGW